jgi:hypothetical protein
MDRLYKPLFLQAVKQCMSVTLPSFLPLKPARGQSNADLFSGCLLYHFATQPEHSVWLCWQPDSGVERRFFVRIGWSPSSKILPAHKEHDRRIYELRGPTAEFPACSLSLEQVLGRGAIGGFEIPSPWDQVYRLKPTASNAEQRQVMQAAAAEAAALTQEQRLTAVTEVVNNVLAHVLSVLPSFLAPSSRTQ